MVEINGSLKKVQVKTTYHRNRWGWFEVSLKTCGGNQSFHTIKLFDNTKVDFLFAITEDGNKYFIPSSNIDAKKALVLAHKYKEFQI